MSPSQLAIDSPDAWLGATVTPGTGTGTLARLDGVVLLVGSTEPDRVRPLLEQAELVAANGGQGRQLVRGFALQLSTGTGDEPPFVAIAPHDTGMAVFVQGDTATVTINGERISGADSLAWVERLVPWPIRQLEASVDPSTAAPTAGPFRLGAGVIPAGGFAIAETEAAPQAIPAESVPVVEQARVAEQPPPAAETPAPESAAPPPPPPPAAVDRPTPAMPEDEHGHFDSILLSDVEADAAQPLPIVSEPGDVSQVADPAVSVEEVRGVYCKNRHFNDPRQLFCAVCGINMVQQTPVLVNGIRPPLGVIVLDDGAVFQLDSDYLLGRDPGADDRVRNEEMRGIPIQDQSNQISRVHARIELRGWDPVLIDNQSTNGTFVNPPKTADWQRLPSGGEHLLTQGTRVRIGHRTLAFNTHAGQ
jgi:FHA domain-containing protein